MSAANRSTSTPARAPALAPALDAPRREIETRQLGRLRYYTDDRVAGRPLVLIHSLNAAPSAYEVRPLFEHYRSIRPVVAPDLPGFGASERGPMRYTPLTYASALADLMAVVAPNGADIVALSLAAELVARWALDAPRGETTLTFVSPTGFGERPLPDPSAFRSFARATAFAMVGEGLFRLLTSRPSLRYFLSQSFAGPVDEDLLEYAHATARQPGARFAPLEFLAFVLFTPDAYDSLYRPLAVPTLVLYDEDPHMTFEKLALWVAEREGRASLRIGPSRGLPHWEKPAETIAALDAFWSSRRADPSSSGDLAEVPDATGEAAETRADLRSHLS